MTTTVRKKKKAKVSKEEEKEEEAKRQNAINCVLDLIFPLEIKRVRVGNKS